MASDESEKGRMTEYEKQRLSRIAENKARLEALLGPSLDSTKPGTKLNFGEEDDDDYRPDEYDDEDDEEEYLGEPSTLPRKRKSKKKEEVGEDDLDKAIALSLQDSQPSCKKTKTGLMSKMQITEDELVIYFYQFDEAGKGFIALRDVAKMVTLHDFTWTQDELQHMIRCFDFDNDGKLSLDEFRKIVRRCRMFKES